MNEPRSCPNSSLSSSDSASAAQCSFTNGPLARGLRSWIAAAISSLPVPDSPVMSTLARDGAICATVLNTACIGAELPMMLSKLYFSARRARSRPASARRRRCSSSRATTTDSSPTLTGLDR